LQHFDTDGSRAFNFYAATKLAFEDMLAYYAEAFDFSAVRLTLCDIYSESDTRRKLMTDIVAAWADRATLKLRSNEVWVDLIHVEDAARAFLQAAYLLENGSIPPGALFHYSISSERDISATELIALFECLGGRKITVERNHNGGSSRTMRPWRGITLPGWEPRVTIEDGIVRILEKLQECEG
jgi:nucleoside-diphosphate-sugar epimerase